MSTTNCHWHSIYEPSNAIISSPTQGGSIRLDVRPGGSLNKRLYEKSHPLHFQFKGKGYLLLIWISKGDYHQPTPPRSLDCYRQYPQSFCQAGVWWSIIKDPALVTLSGRWDRDRRGWLRRGHIFLWWTGKVGEQGHGREESEYYLHKINSSKEWVHTPIKLVNWLSMLCPRIYNTTTLFILGPDREDSPICMGVLNVINNHNATCIFNGAEMGTFNIHKGQTIAYDIKLSITS